MIFSYNWIREYVKVPRAAALAELLTMHSFEVGEVKKVGKDYALAIDVLSNRAADCFSHIGIARECAVLVGAKLKIPAPKLQENKHLQTKDFITVTIQDKDDCPRYTARVVTKVTVGSSPQWIQQRLKVCGIRPINSIVDITNYVMLETGQPLHAFDYDKIAGQNRKIIVRRAEKEEKILTLDGKRYHLDNDILVIADEKGPLALAGIKGGKRAEVDKGTTTIVLESANFAAKRIRKSAQRVGLATDASRRFEHEIDPNLTEVAINRAAFLIQKIAKGKPAVGVADVYPKKVRPKMIKLDVAYVGKLLGIAIPKTEVVSILKRLGFTFKSTGRVEVPTFRRDITLPEDLIEEIGRVYGYQRIPAVFPTAALIPPKKNFDVLWENKIKDILKELGFSEMYNYSFVGAKELSLFEYKSESVAVVANPASIEQQYLRPSLIPNLLKNVKENLKHVTADLKIFEFGNIFACKKGGPQEKRMITMVFTGTRGQDAFYHLKGTIDVLLNRLGINGVWYDAYQATPEESKRTIWHSQKAAEIKVGQNEIGFLGTIASRVTKVLKIAGSVVVCDIDFEKLSSLCTDTYEYRPISPFPAATRDIAVLVPRGTKVVEVLNSIEIAGGTLLIDVDLFDMYEGDTIPGGKKNLAFHLVYQAKDRTLGAKEIDSIQENVIKTLEKDPEWEVRK